jgi:hypothetical protein
MPINVICPNAGCQKRFTVPDNAAGKSATCTNCGTKIAIPAEGDEFEEERAPKKRSKADFDVDDEEDAPKSRKKGRTDDDDRDDDDDRGRGRGRPKRRASSGGDSNFVLDLLLLRFMIAPIAVPALVWLGTLYILIDGLWTSIDVFRFQGFMAGLRLLGLVLLTPIILRVTGEALLAMIRMSEAVNEVKNNTKKDAPPPAA